jgi:hypothetical protein
MPIDSPRFLHTRSEHGYTEDPSRAMRNEPEAISERAAHDLAMKAAAQDAERQRAEWAARRSVIARELSWLHSQRFRKDVRSQTRALERQLQRLDSVIGT